MDKELSVVCRACGALVGEPCRNQKSGAPLVGYHSGRSVHAALARTNTSEKKSRSERYGISKVTQYKAADGTMHDTWQAAVKHTNETAFQNWLYEWLGARVDHRNELSASTEQVARQLAADLRAAWNIYRRKL